jgi:DNA-binding GntR family transcriptional regulator
MVTRPSLVGPIIDVSPSLTERAIEAVRMAIRNGTMVPGELYTVNQLATELGVSRSPARDALLRLEETGVIKFERYRGFRLQLPGPEDLAQIFAVRVALEIPAARKAAACASDTQIAELKAVAEALRKAAMADEEPEFMLHDQKLHGLVLDFAGNQYARKVIDNIRDATRLIGASTFQSFRTLVEVYQEHAPIVDAIAARDPVAASSAMYQHLRQTGRLLLRKSIGLDRPNVEAESDRLWNEFVEFGTLPAPGQ